MCCGSLTNQLEDVVKWLSVISADDHRVGTDAVLECKLIEDAVSTLPLDVECLVSVTEGTAFEQFEGAIGIFPVGENDRCVVCHVLFDAAALNPNRLNSGLRVALSIDVETFSRDVLLSQ